MNTTTKRTSRPKRASINGKRNVLTVTGKEPGYEYRVVNDVGDRIAQFESDGWEVVQDQNIKVGDRRVANPTKEGSPIRVSVGNGQQAYVMRMREDWFKENQQDKSSAIDEMEKGMKREAGQSADYGKLSVGV